MSSETFLFVAPSSKEEDEENKSKTNDINSLHSEDLRLKYGESLYETKQHLLDEKFPRYAAAAAASNHRRKRAHLF